MKKGKIIILSGPSGAGKTTLYEKLLREKKLKNKIVRSVSVTTRLKRKGEREGKDYFFISQKMFAYKRKAKHFLENEKVFNNYYGTPYKNVKDLLSKGKNVLLCIDVKGARTVRRKHPGAIKIFVKTKSLSDLKGRLLKRGTDSIKTVNLRLSIAGKELKETFYYDKIIINDKLSQAYNVLLIYIISQL